MRQLKITKQVTNRETASLDKYLQEIGKVDLITAEEEVELAQKIKAGSQIALEKLRTIESLSHEDRITIIDIMGDLAQSQYDKGMNTAISVYRR